jgi:hypothetical protein
MSTIKNNLGFLIQLALFALLMASPVMAGVSDVDDEHGFFFGKIWYLAMQGNFWAIVSILLFIYFVGILIFLAYGWIFKPKK